MSLRDTIAKELPFELPPTFVRDAVCTVALVGVVLLALLRG